MPDLIVQGYNLSSVIPTAPSHKQIIFHDCDADNQYWRRPYSLTDREFLKLSYSEQEEIVDIENERCREGAWFYNRGVPTYLTGDNYYFLTYHRIDGTIIPDYMGFQTLDYYFQKFCEVDTDCFGRIDLKPRREGDTQRKLATATNRAIGNESFFVGIQSKTGKDAKEVNFGGLVLAFNKLPCWKKPMARLDNPSRELAFEQPPKRATGKIKTIKEIEYEDYYLNSKIDWRATSSDAYDGDKLHIYIQDEYFKWVESDAYKAWLTHKKCLVDGEDIIGKAYLLSTVGIEEEEEKVSEEALLNGVKLWKGSDANEKNSIGQTETGLYRWFIPSYVSRRFKKRGWPDKYGNVPEDEVKKYLFEKRKAETDPQKLMIIIRQEPMNVQEALSSMLQGMGTFNNFRLDKRFQYLTNFEPELGRPEKYRVGNFAWENNIRFSNVVWNDNENGRFKIPYFPEFFGDNLRNHVKRTSNDSFLPFSDTPFASGGDPFNYSKTVSGEGSKGAFHIKHRWRNIYCCHYRFRAASPDLFNEDYLMALWFFGARANPERSGSNIFDWFKRNGVYGFIMPRPDVTKNSAFTKSDTEKGTTPSPENVELGCNLIENFLAKPDEHANENVVDNLNYFWDEETIEQLMAFDKKKREKYDCVMAMIHTEIGAQSIKKLSMNRVITGENKTTPLDVLIPMYREGKPIIRADKDKKRIPNFRYATPK